MHAAAALNETRAPPASLADIVIQVGPYSNPAETYRYYSLPFCEPENYKSQAQQLGEVLAGDRRVTTMYDIRFRGASVRKSLRWHAVLPPAASVAAPNSWLHGAPVFLGAMLDACAMCDRAAYVRVCARAQWTSWTASCARRR